MFLFEYRNAHLYKQSCILTYTGRMFTLSPPRGFCRESQHRNNMLCALRTVWYCCNEIAEIYWFFVLFFRMDFNAQARAKLTIVGQSFVRSMSDICSSNAENRYFRSEVFMPLKSQFASCLTLLHVYRRSLICSL